jgi:lipoprotein-anchoring transpeptidase ErfK/SrfK
MEGPHMTHTALTRRQFLASATAASLALPARAQDDWLMPEAFTPRVVEFVDPQLPGSIIVDPEYFELYFAATSVRAVQYTVGIGKGDLYEYGRFTVGAKKRWPSWTPTQDMIARNPDQYARYADGMPGGPGNPLGSRALYLFDDQGADTFLRIHGTPEPWTIGQAVSNGCVRLANEHIEMLYDAVEVGAEVILMPRFDQV